MTRFEPATSGSTDRRSNQLSYIHHKRVLPYFIKLEKGWQILPLFILKNVWPRVAQISAEKNTE